MAVNLSGMSLDHVLELKTTYKNIGTGTVVREA